MYSQHFTSELEEVRQLDRDAAVAGGPVVKMRRVPVLVKHSPGS